MRAYDLADTSKGRGTLAAHAFSGNLKHASNERRETGRIKGVEEDAPSTRKSVCEIRV